jgi:hypothetical protein
MSTQSVIPPHHYQKRLVFILRIWPHGSDGQEWIGEVQDIATGETIHTQNLEALFEWLKQRTEQQMLLPNQKVDLSENTKE